MGTAFISQSSGAFIRRGRPAIKIIKPFGDNPASLPGVSYFEGTPEEGIIAFKTVGTHTLTPLEDCQLDVLVVGGGGGGGGGVNGGGGGAGGVVYFPGFNVLSSQGINLTVGAGGIGGIGYLNQGTQGGTSGQNSVFANLIANGGGRGSGRYASSHSAADNGHPGGSGGGGQNHNIPEAGYPSNQPSFTGAFVYGNKGGDAIYRTGVSPITGGGGGGAGGPGQPPVNGSVGGIGLNMSHIFGTGIGVNGWLAAGGGGGNYGPFGGSYSHPNWTGLGGQGGGGNGTTISSKAGDGLANTGSGGGGTGYNGASTARLGGSGGSGIVVITWGNYTPTT